MFFHNLSPEEHERLSYLLEELGETQHCIGKILRHGYDSTHPEGGPTNRQMLSKELGDVFFAINWLVSNKDIDEDIIIEVANKSKRGEINKYLHHNQVKTNGVE
jgi:NTP pyrophosphatase (non-canonical NTP hydrolase)